MASPTLRVALIHDWLTGMRGGEKVLEVLCSFFPDATLFTLFHARGAMSPRIESMSIRSSWIGRLPFAPGHFRAYLPFFPTAIESFDLSGYDLVISSSHCVAKGAIPAAGALHLSYIHTPMRYIWDMYPHYLGSRAGWVKRAGGALLAAYLRRWDVASCRRVNLFIANSQNVRERIHRHYHREAEVIYPPLDAELFYPTGSAQDYYLMVTALVPYKRVELAITAFNQMGEKLIIVGDGPERERLQKLAGSTVSFLPWQSDDALRQLYSGCRALIFPGEEDFGIVPLEAQACGRPVIALGRGGVLETVVPLNLSGEQVGAGPPPTGVFFYHDTAQDLLAAVGNCASHAFDSAAIRRHALEFDKSIFRWRLAEFLQDRIKEKFGLEVNLAARAGGHGA